MNIAYIISVHKQPDLLLRLIDRLNDDGMNFFVHVDKRTDQRIFDRIVIGSRHLPNLHLLERHRCYWGDFGHVRASLKGVTEFFRRNIPFDYAVLLTGQDYPIKTIAQIQEFFERNNGKSFMAHFPLPTTEWAAGGLERVNQYHLHGFNRHYVIPIRRRFPKGFQLFGGSSYWCLARDCIEYIYTFINMNRGFVDFFKYVDVPDEIFFQTVLMNSPLAATIVNDDLRYIDWKEPDAGSPSVLGKNDFPKLAASPKLFARKFDENTDIDVLDMIDREILEITDHVAAR